VEGFVRRDLERVDVLPDPGARGAEVRDPRRHRDPRPGERHRTTALLQQPRKSPAPDYFPFHFGFRLPRNASLPSRASSELNAVTKPPFSASTPSSRSAFAETFLIWSTATGAWSASFRAHSRAASNSSWSGTTSLASPISYAWAAEIESPRRFISSQPASPTRRASRWVPPNPGMIPRLISG